MKRLGLALSSGGPRGAAHVGVLKALEDAGLRPYAIAGASAGAQAGGLYAAGIPISQIEVLWKEIRPRTFKALIPTFPIRGWSRGRIITRTLNTLVGGVRIEELPLKFAAVATDIRTGESVVFTEGYLVDALRASMSVPGLLVPARLAGRCLVDGGVADPLPVDVVRRLGAEVVVAVDVLVSPAEKRLTRPHVFSVIFQTVTIFQKQVVELKAQLSRPEILIRPDFGPHPPTYLDIGQGIEAGYRAMERALPRLRELLEG
jgi:NTE family protein